MNVDPTLAFVTVERLCEVGWGAFGSHDWLPYEYKTGKLSRITGSDPMVGKLADGTVENVNGTESICTFNRGEFATRGISFEFAKAVWLRYLEVKMH